MTLLIETPLTEQQNWKRNIIETILPASSLKNVIKDGMQAHRLSVKGESF